MNDFRQQKRPPRNLSVPQEELTRIVERDGERLDAFLARVHPWRSRAQFQQLIDDGKVTVNGGVSKASRRLKMNDRVAVEVEPQATPDYDALMPPVLHRDEHLLFINKPAGLAVHPVSKRPYRNLLSVLHHQFREEPYLPQLLHRLDEYTSGVIVASTNLAAHNHVRLQFLHHQVGKVYLAICAGEPPAQRTGLIDAPIAISDESRSQSEVDDEEGKDAVSRYALLAAHAGRLAFLVRPLTGRQHQVRLHLAHLGYPLLGDVRYGGLAAPGEFDRYALHALCLQVTHPGTQQRLTVTAPPPADMAAALARLQVTGSTLQQAAEALLAQH